MLYHAFKTIQGIKGMWYFCKKSILSYKIFNMKHFPKT